MATQQRIDNLSKFCEQWKDHLQDAEMRRDKLLFWRSNGLSIYENNGENLLPALIAEADGAALQYNKIFIKMEFLRDRAIAARAHRNVTNIAPPISPCANKYFGSH
jgi:hypothetical protein